MNLKKHYGKLLPEKAIVMFGLRLIVYLDENGTELIDWKLDGDARLGHVIGALEVTKTQMIAAVEEPTDA